ncbi:MAG: FadR family transcriptional regulator [Geminicoccaceae bacterium]|nr:FadR family transcriptional regulator [Geminicoccaceae bacterium]MCX7631559.1 FadR family transcriptional regulator [Geminicoccaceae bacterium]MDW8124760.1 FadR/GntR family transcriptional regulator [Geminicoccaceae bacterium]MDW8341427.1 FadR/GntR family transcriptional regulator [Geminicoccaceae bacterium]
MTSGETESALIRLRAWLANRPADADKRLPPERELAHMLGVSRGTLRKALAVLEAEGTIWRHVGRGTFVGDRPVEPLLDLSDVIRRTSPAHVMEARFLLEPELARLAALNGTAADLDELRLCLRQSRLAPDWRSYEYWDNRLHRGIAQATGNTVLLALLDGLDTIRRAIAWGRLRRGPQRPPPDHHSFAEHEAVVAAIAERDPQAAATAMRRHLASVRARLFAALGLEPVPGSESGSAIDAGTKRVLEDVVPTLPGVRA